MILNAFKTGINAVSFLTVFVFIARMGAEPGRPHGPRPPLFETIVAEFCQYYL